MPDTDLHEAFEAAKRAEQDKEHEQQRLLCCFNLKCTCEPGAGLGWLERDASGV